MQDKRKHMKAIHHADQENARLNEQRAASPDGMTPSERAMSSTQTAAQHTPGPEALPELLKALRACADALDCCYDVCDYPASGDTEQDEARRLARAVLAKVEGGAA